MNTNTNTTVISIAPPYIQSDRWRITENEIDK